MAKILIGWEYGSGFGHVALLVPLAQYLKQQGHEPVLALKDCRTTQHLWLEKGIPIIQAPYIPMRADWDRDTPTDTLADIFVLAGLSNSDTVTALGRAWQNVLSSVKPDIVICEFSPTLAMVTLGVIPTITIGSSYAIPPSGRNLPPIRFWQDELKPYSIEHETIMHTSINRSRTALGLPEVEFFSDLFSGDAVFVCSLPELDCYSAHRQSPVIGPLTALSTNLTINEHIEQYRYKAFAYLAGDEKCLAAIIEQLGNAPFEVDGYIRHLSKEMRASFNPKVMLHETPQNLEEVLLTRGILIHHGGMSTADLGLRMGIPQLVISRHLEQNVSGVLMAQLGVAGVIPIHKTIDENILASTLAQIPERPNMRLNCLNRAKMIAERKARPAMEIINEACERLGA